MAIQFDESGRVITIQTKHSTYQMKADEHDILLHTYYGRKTDGSDLSYAIRGADRGFCGNLYEVGKTDRTYSLDAFPQEYSSFGTGDYRITALRALHADGSRAAELRFTGAEQKKGKYGIPGLPAVYAGEDEAETLIAHMKDPYTGLCADLYYGVLPSLDVITRAVRIKNDGGSPVVLEKAASMNLDFPDGDYEWLTFHGRHAMERNLQRTAIAHGVQSVGSVRGASSHQYHPFVILGEAGFGETHGCCAAVSFVYSGEFLIEAEKDQLNQTRLLCGLHPDDFAWRLEAGEELWLPEAILTFSDEGTGRLSQNLHRTIRRHVCRGEWKTKQRPVLINNWEATYFHFNAGKLVSIAKDAAALGVDMLVMDDGWFGCRESDNSGLGDWTVNEEKLGCTLGELVRRINACGLKFGIWFEPEAISEDSDLYRAHPDWAVAIPGRNPNLSRNQLILDVTRRDVQDYLIGRISDILTQAPIDYVKWDFNRSICDKFSHGLTAASQGEFAHRFVLGLYRVLEELTTRFPHVLFEGCSGGGGRFDAGMLYYTPQIWCSDDTDAIERLEIQYGTSFGYPVSAMGAHVSAVPNHQTFRVTPLETRGSVAMAGTFGYELDINKMTPEEKGVIKEQISRFRRHCALIQDGDYYRIKSPLDGDWTAWEMAAEDGSEALLTIVCTHLRANAPFTTVRFMGLKESARYQLTLENKPQQPENPTLAAMMERLLPYGYREGQTLTGSALMKCGITVPSPVCEYQAWQIYAREV